MRQSFVFISLILFWQSNSLANNSSVSIFGSLAYSYENEDKLGFSRDGSFKREPKDDGSWLTDSQLGIQYSYRLNKKWSAVIQGILANKVENDLDSVIEWAFIKYSFTPDLNIRLGRLGFNTFMLSDTRQVDYSFLWVRPPTEVYGWIASYYLNGGDITYNFSHNNFYHKLTFQYGQNSIDVQSIDASTTLSNNVKDYYGLTYTSTLNTLTTRVSYVELKSQSKEQLLQNLNQGLVDISISPLLPTTITSEANFFRQVVTTSAAKLRYYQAGLHYNGFDWQIIGELTIIDTPARSIPSGDSGYLSVGRNINNLTPYISYSFFNPKRKKYSSPNDWSLLGENGLVLQAAAVATFNDAVIKQQTYSAGIRWDLQSQMALKFQWDHTQIPTDNGLRLWAADNNFQQTKDTSVNVFTVALNFVY